MADRGLTPKQQRFVEEYLVDLNASAAALRAGYASGDIGRQLLTKPHVQTAISTARRQVSQAAGVRAEDVVKELAKVAFSDIRQFVTWGPDGVCLLASDKLPDGAAACVAEVSQVTTKGGGSIKFKLHPKVTALDKLAQHLGLYQEKSPLETLLAALPPELAGALRQELARLLAQGGSSPGGSSSPNAPTVP